MDRYSQIEETKSPTGKNMYKTVRYPDIPRTEDDIYVFTTIGDRFDILALQYYGDSSLWWIISIANDNLYQNSLTPPVGSQIRIPSNQAPIISAYKSINS
tara:strand:+ start:256 stop:555 length:300 start_codon:yes stop_codon:yes gene_type:complete